jgi:hypothetical protein
VVVIGPSSVPSCVSFHGSVRHNSVVVRMLSRVQEYTQDKVGSEWQRVSGRWQQVAAEKQSVGSEQGGSRMTAGCPHTDVL